MEKTNLATRLARRRHITKARAKDQIDSVVHAILRKLRHGQAATLPGLGTLRPGKQRRIRFENAAGSARKGKK